MVNYSQLLHVDWRSFLDMGIEYIAMGDFSEIRWSDSECRRLYKVWYGCSPEICAKIWTELQLFDLIANCARSHPEYLLWALDLLRCYDLEERSARFYHTTAKTFRTWSKHIINGIANLDKNCIKWSNRFRNSIRNKCLVTVDGIHFKIPEPRPFAGKWMSHKLGGSALSYEICICVMTGDIVSFNGPFPAGSWSDLRIFKSFTKGRLCSWEKVVADLGYRGDIKIVTRRDANNPQHRKAISDALARHETINGRLTRWNCLYCNFRHSRHDHHMFFRAVLALEQIKKETGEGKPFQVLHYIDPFL